MRLLKPTATGGMDWQLKQADWLTALVEHTVRQDYSSCICRLYLHDHEAVAEFCDLPGTVQAQSCYSVTYLEQFGHKFVILWLTWNSSGTKLLFCDLPGTVRAQSCYSVTYLEQLGHQAVAKFCDQLHAAQNVPVRRQHHDEQTADGQGTKWRHLCVWNKNNSITLNFTYSNT